MKMKIGELAKMAGCPVVTVRFYEKEGLLGKPERTGSNYRVYGENDMERLRFVMHCRQHDMKLSEIRELLAFRDNPRADCRWINTMVENHMSKVEEQIQSLTKLKEQLSHLLTQCNGDNTTGCGILESLSLADSCPYCEDFRCKSEGHGRIARTNGTDEWHGRMARMRGIPKNDISGCSKT